MPALRSLLAVFGLLLAAPVFAQGPITLGANHQGTLDDPMDVDTWTLSVNTGDRLMFSFTTTPQAGTGGFNPQFLVTSPSSGQFLNSNGGGRSELVATETGTYTLLARSQVPSAGGGTYFIRVVKVPGSNTVPAGDQGGPLTDAVASTGQIPLGDLDTWTFTGCAGATPRLTLSETPPDAGNGFNPGFHLYGPAGQHVESGIGTTEYDVTTFLPSAGTYTLVVYSGIAFHTGTGQYSIRVSGMCGTGAPPIGQNDGYTVAVNGSLTVPAPGVLGNDQSPGGHVLSAALVSPPAHGVLSLSANGGFTYTPAPGYVGGDMFQYRPGDVNGQGNDTAVVLTVSGVTTVQPPSGLVAAAINGHTVTLQWTPPTAGPAPTSYVIDGGLSPGDTLASLPTGGAIPVYTFAAPTGSFYVRVRAVAGNTSSAPSNEIQIHVDVPVPPSAPADLLGVANGSTLGLAWKNTFAGGAPTGLTLQVTGALTASLPLPMSDHFTFSGVPPGTYTLSLRATNPAGVSAPSNSVTLSFPQGCSGVPLAPIGLVAYKTGTTIHVSWQPAASGAAPTAYVLNVSGTLNASLPVGSLRAISGAVPPGTYALSVAALNACGTNGSAGPVSVTIP